MTPDARREWYLEMAEEFGWHSASTILMGCDPTKNALFVAHAAKRARFAAHFGRLALGETGDESWVRRRFRQELWVNHGCGFYALYGDDGEMQCGVCHVDFKREPIEELVQFVEFKRMKRVADALAAEAQK